MYQTFFWAYLTLITILWSRCYYHHHFIDEETEAQREWITYSRSKAIKWWDLGFEPKSQPLESVLLLLCWSWHLRLMLTLKGLSLHPWCLSGKKETTNVYRCLSPLRTEAIPLACGSQPSSPVPHLQVFSSSLSQERSSMRHECWRWNRKVHRKSENLRIQKNCFSISQPMGR